MDSGRIPLKLIEESRLKKKINKALEFKKKKKKKAKGEGIYMFLTPEESQIIPLKLQ